MERIVQDHDADFFLSHSPELNEDLDDFARMYQPKSINNDPIEFSDFSGYKCHPDTSKPHNVMSMWINRQRVFQEMRNYMINTNTWYDVVIHARIDTWYDEPLNYGAMSSASVARPHRDLWSPNGHSAFGEPESTTNPPFIEDDGGSRSNPGLPGEALTFCPSWSTLLNKDNTIQDQEVFVPHGYDWGGLNDQFAMGSYYSMESYMSLYDDVQNVLDHVTIPDLEIHENRNMPRAYYYGPEPCLKKHLELQGVLVHRFHFRYRLINGKVFHRP